MVVYVVLPAVLCPDFCTLVSPVGFWFEVWYGCDGIRGVRGERRTGSDWGNERRSRLKMY